VTIDRLRALGGLGLSAALIAAIVVGPRPAHAAASDPDSHVCGLVSLSYVRNLVGRPATFAEVEDDNGGASCLYELSANGPVITLSLLDAQWPAVEAEYLDAPETRVPALGPHAFWSQRDSALHVLAPNGQVMRISVARREGDWRGPDLELLAQRFAAQALQTLKAP
jgi:hypothetical protein